MKGAGDFFKSKMANERSRTQDTPRYFDVRSGLGGARFFFSCEAVSSDIMDPSTLDACISSLSESSEAGMSGGVGLIESGEGATGVSKGALGKAESEGGGGLFMSREEEGGRKCFSNGHIFGEVVGGTQN